jgi:hypothetical protein
MDHEVKIDQSSRSLSSFERDFQTCEGCKKKLKEKSHPGGKKNRFPIRCAGTKHRKCRSKLCRKCWYACLSAVEGSDEGNASGVSNPDGFKYWRCGPCCRTDSVKCCECDAWTSKKKGCVYDCCKCEKGPICEGCIGNDMEHDREKFPLCSECVGTSFWCDHCEALVSVFDDPKNVPARCAKGYCRAALCSYCWDRVRSPSDHVESDEEEFGSVTGDVKLERLGLDRRVCDLLSLWYCSTCQKIDDI